ncbi:unnamed protein product [Brassicogethes aeneus]|uniref:Alpha-carbonic anhydrase domain-containing protein n=1 Tax=Brassicogethes aeneus TaxID=1431903 RepID=A0A9P0FJB1_BRAAE|nr:unnamed protein product [Brassicogethes aeneus]
MEEDIEKEDLNEYPEDIDDEDLDEDDTIQGYVRRLANTESIPLSPIDINIVSTVQIETPNLEWVNFDVQPRKMKITNSGHTGNNPCLNKNVCKINPTKNDLKYRVYNARHIVVLIYSKFLVLVSAKWEGERPYIAGGPLRDNYVFSQLHFHWGTNDMEGSEHTTDGMKHPAELHVVTYKSCYSTQEAALKHVDGIVILVYFIRLKGGDHPLLWKILDILPEIQIANTSFKIKPFPLEDIITPFNDDYFGYWGSVITTEYSHFVL